MFASEMAKEQLQADAQQRKFERRQSLGGDAEVRLPLRVHAIFNVQFCVRAFVAQYQSKWNAEVRVQPVLC